VTSRWLRVAAASTAAVTFGLYAEHGRRELGRGAGLALLDLLAGFVFVAAGIAIASRRPTNRCWWLLVAAGGTWFLSTLSGVAGENASLVGFVLGAWHYLFLGWLLLAFPSGRILSGRGRLLLGSICLLLTARSLVRLLVYVPPDGTGCDCVHNRFTGVADRRWFDAAEAAYPWLLTGLFLLVMVEVVLRWRRSSGAGRRMLAPVLAMAAAVAAQIAYTQVIRQELAWAVVRAEDLFVLVVVVRSVAAYSLVVGMRRTGPARAAVVEMVGGLDDVANPGRLEAALRHAVQDPSLQLILWNPGPWPPDAGQGRAVTMIDGEAGHLAALVHDEALLEDPGLVGAITAAVRLTIDNERLRSELQARLDDLAASRARIIATADDERRRIERDLHDGTQQRLVTIALQLRLALMRLGEGASPATAEALSSAIAGLGDAVEEVRDLARGIHPAILGESGLEAALESLVARSPLDVRAELCLGAEPPANTAAAAYFCVSEALTNAAKHAGAARVVVTARTTGDDLEVTVSDDGVGGAAARPEGSGLTGLADRVSASGGTLDVDSPPQGGTRLRVVLPCG
jgi:signal transduction histidine kinase